MGITKSTFPENGSRESDDLRHIASRARIIALVVVSLTSFLTPFMSSAVNVAMPRIGREFALNAVALNWLATSFILACAAFLVPFGRLADLVGTKRVFGVGVAVYTGASLVAGFARSAAALIVFRVVQGVGSAMIFGTGMAIVTFLFPPGERGKALGYNAALTYLGLSLGPVLGGIITQHLGWRWIFFFTVPPGLAALGLLGGGMKVEWATGRGEKFDAVGSVSYMLGLVSVMAGLSLLPSRAGGALIVAGLAAVVGFALLESRVRFPVFNVGLLRTNVPFAFSSLAAFVNYSATAGAGFLLSLYLQYLRGMSPQKAGLVLVAQPVVMAAFSPVAGRLSDRVESRVIASAGMAVTAASLCLFAFLTPRTPLWSVVVVLALLGFGFGLFSSPNMNAIMSSVDPPRYGQAGATLATMRLTGQMASYGIVMLLSALFVGRVRIGPAQLGPLLATIRTAFAVFTALCAAGIFASLARGKMKK